MILRIKKLFSAFLAALLTFFSGLHSETLRYKKFSADVRFSPLSAQELALSDEEKAACRRWFDENVRFAGTNGLPPAYDFAVNGVHLRDALKSWRFSVGKESAAGAFRRGGKTTWITLQNEAQGLTARVEATIYEENATCEWTVYLQNNANRYSGVISDFYAADCALALGETEVYCSKGSHNAAEDFALLKAKLRQLPLTAGCEKGRATDAFLPYFNLTGSKGGAVVGVGWTGLWEVCLRQKADDVRLRVKQQKLLAPLLPGEEIRSPLVSLSFYDGKNPVKGFNLFRGWITSCVYPENAPAVQNNMDILFVSHTRTANEMLYDINRLDASVLPQIANFWMDAGWYAGCEEDWGDGVGNWYTNSDRFPNGIREISDKAKSLGLGVVLWYEPERLTSRSRLYEVGTAPGHEHWLVNMAPLEEFNTRIMWNLAEPDARAYLTDYIASSLIENGVSVYRQDFNYDPAPYWRYADKAYYGGRTGICENHYVSGLYAYLDGLFAAVPGLVMDNCASGGMRLDLEMTRRSVPMWRSDYNCDQNRPDLPDATQAHTYGLSCWLPVSGTFVNFSDEYAARSSIIPILQVPMATTEAQLAAILPERQQMAKQYFPLDCGGTDPAKITAMQFGDAESGSVLIYKHADVKETSYAVRFSGLDETALYTVTDIDVPDAALKLRGADLMAGDCSVPLPEGRKAIVLRYARAN